MAIQSPLYGRLAELADDELLQIWQRNDPNDWTEEAYAVIEQILKARLGDLPAQDDPVAAERSLECAQQAIRDAHYGQALHACNEAVKLAPHFGRAYWLRGHVLSEMGRFDDVANNAQKAAQLAPNHADIDSGLRHAADWLNAPWYRQRRKIVLRGMLWSGLGFGLTWGLSHALLTLAFWGMYWSGWKDSVWTTAITRIAMNLQPLLVGGIGIGALIAGCGIPSDRRSFIIIESGVWTIANVNPFPLLWRTYIEPRMGSWEWVSPGLVELVQKSLGGACLALAIRWFANRRGVPWGHVLATAIGFGMYGIAFGVTGLFAFDFVTRADVLANRSNEFLTLVYQLIRLTTAGLFSGFCGGAMLAVAYLKWMRRI